LRSRAPIADADLNEKSRATNSQKRKKKKVYTVILKTITKERGAQRFKGEKEKERRAAFLHRRKKRPAVIRGKKRKCAIFDRCKHIGSTTFPREKEETGRQVSPTWKKKKKKVLGWHVEHREK